MTDRELLIKILVEGHRIVYGDYPIDREDIEEIADAILANGFRKITKEANGSMEEV